MTHLDFSLKGFVSKGVTSGSFCSFSCTYSQRLGGREEGGMGGGRRERERGGECI